MDIPQVLSTCTGLVWTTKASQIGCANVHALRRPFDRRSSERAQFRTLTHALRLSLVHLDYKPTWASIPARNSNTAENRAPLLNLVSLSDQRSVGSDFGSYQGHTLLARYSIMSLFSALDAQYGSP
jgi:hypothetical protein